MSFDTSGGDITFFGDAGGGALGDGRRRDRWFKITGGTNPYSAVEIFVDETDGTNTETNQYVIYPASIKQLWDIAGSASVVVDSLVRAFANPHGSGWVFDSRSSGAGSQILLVPIQRIEIAPPATGCDSLDDCTSQCWGPYYWCRVVTPASTCGAWACGGCAFLRVVDGLPIPLGVAIPGWILGSPPSEILAAPLPVDFECSEEELASAPLYGVYAGPRSYIAVPGDAAGWCADPESGAYFQVYECELFSPWQDCETLPGVGPGYMADVNGCSTPPGIRQVVHFHRMLRGDEFSEPGDPRACAPLFIYKRPKNWPYRFETAGGRLKIYGPDAGPCGDTETLLQDLPCCDPDGDSPPGGEGCCEGQNWPAGGTNAFVPGVGYVPGSWSSADGVFYFSFFAPGCGTQVWMRFDPDSCELDYSCDRSSWVGLTVPVTWDIECGPPNITAGPWDALDPDAAPAGCSDNSCTTINGIYIVAAAP